MNDILDYVDASVFLDPSERNEISHGSPVT